MSQSRGEITPGFALCDTLPDFEDRGAPEPAPADEAGTHRGVQTKLHELSLTPTLARQGGILERVVEPRPHNHSRGLVPLVLWQTEVHGLQSHGNNREEG
jgi:hypothetical protein